eukprot:518705-Pelagomonas_calceolata.AAC.11
MQKSVAVILKSPPPASGPGRRHSIMCEGQINPRNLIQPYRGICLSLTRRMHQDSAEALFLTGLEVGPPRVLEEGLGAQAFSSKYLPSQTGSG